MRQEGVLRSLGSQPTAGRGEGEGLPASGNVLEMEAWRPRSHTSVLRRHGGKFPTTAPSQRYTTVEALGSLPLPEESAQTLVVKAGAEGEGKRRRRRSSVSDFLRRKLSRSGSGLFGRKDGACYYCSLLCLSITHTHTHTHTQLCMQLMPVSIQLNVPQPGRPVSDNGTM